MAPRTLPKSPLGDALRYLDQQWVALQQYLTDGELLIDNNNAERQLRSVAVGRNYAEFPIMWSTVGQAPSNGEIRRIVSVVA